MASMSGWSRSHGVSSSAIPANIGSPMRESALGRFWAHASGTGLSCNNTCPGPPIDASCISPGWTSQAGLRYVASRNFMVFTEWRYMATTAHFDDVRSFSNIVWHTKPRVLLAGLGYSFR
jgi:hypothetical protein